MVPSMAARPAPKASSQTPTPRRSPPIRGRQLLTLNQPRPVHVVTDVRDQPVTIHLGGRARRVEHLRESWRIDDEWWRTPISRMYVRVVLDTGRLVTLYLDLEEQRWYLQDA